MSDWLDKLPAAAREYLDGKRLDEVECIIPDLPGIARGKAVPATKFAGKSIFIYPTAFSTRPSPENGAKPLALTVLSKRI